MFGVAIGILVMRYAAGLFSIVVEKALVLKTAAYILVFNIGVELILKISASTNSPTGPASAFPLPPSPCAWRMPISPSCAFFARCCCGCHRDWGL